jgi:hypothetical protein
VIRNGVLGVLGVLGMLGTAACSDRDKPEIKPSTERVRRVIEPSPRGMRALPPHAIRAEGVGPYKLGVSAAEVLDQLPSGPRIQQFSIPGIVNRDMLRGEDDAILIGTEPQGKSTFVAVVRGEIARTEAGIQVGSTREELERSLGAPVELADHAHDPRVIVPTKLDNAHVVLEGDRIVAIVLVPAERLKDGAKEATKDGAKDGGKETTPTECTRPEADRTKGLVGVCLTASGDVARVSGDELAIIGKDGDKAVTAVRAPGLLFAVPLKNPFDGRDDLVALTRVDDGQTRTWSLIAYRLIDGKLMRVIEPTTLYQITAANARWIGAELDQIDLLLELTAKSDSIEVGGLLTTRSADKIRDIVVITPVPVARRRAKVTMPEASDAGLSDAGGAGSSAK